MRIAVLRERASGEHRVAVTPDIVRKYRTLGLVVTIESGAGTGARFDDAAYAEAGAAIASDAATALTDVEILLCVQRPEGVALPRGLIVIGMLNPHAYPAQLAADAAAGIASLSLELLPRTTRAQAMDVLSSQASLAGYQAVLEAAQQFGRALPMMMTAAGTVPPARVFIMGAGVAGLQAIATARRLGAQVAATDVRLAAREQVQSLGASFVAVDNEESRQAETSGGYAKEMSDDYKRQQAALIAETIRKQDIVITTAQIPGRRAPVLITGDMVHSMKPGAIILDMAVGQGGNCALSQPDQIICEKGVRIIGWRNLPARIATDASQLYARNLYNLIALGHEAKTNSTVFPWQDELVKAVTLTRDGAIVHSQFSGAAA